MQFRGEIDEKANGKAESESRFVHELYLRRNPAKIAGGEGGRRKVLLAR